MNGKITNYFNIKQQCKANHPAIVANKAMKILRLRTTEYHQANPNNKYTPQTST